MKYIKTLSFLIVLCLIGLGMTACATVPGGPFRPAYDMSHGILVDDWYVSLQPGGHWDEPPFWTPRAHMCQYADGVIITVDGDQGWCP